MFCKKCGKEIGDNETYCTYCGAPQNDVPPQQAPPAYSANAPVDGSSFGWAFLGFLIPLVGLILFLVWKDTLPLRSKSCGKGALVGVILYVIFIIISVAIGACAAASAYDYYAAVVL